MNTQTAFRHILVPVDGSAPSDAGLREALRVAGASGAALTALHVLEEPTYAFDPMAVGIDYTELFEYCRTEGEKVVKAASEACERAGVPAKCELVEARGNRVADVIADEVSRRGADLIVMGTHGRRGMDRLLLGSDAELVLRLTATPLLLTHGGEGALSAQPAPGYKRILVPVDGSETSSAGLERAIQLAAASGAVLRLVHVVFIPPMFSVPGGFGLGDIVGGLKKFGRELLQRASSQAEQAGVKAETALLQCNGGRIADSVDNEAREWKADLIVIGTHGRRGINRLAMGSDAELIVRNATQPVLLVHAPQAAKLQGPQESRAAVA